MSFRDAGQFSRNSREAVARSGDGDAQLILAIDRTLLAEERTYAAWVRTGLAALASGIAARAFLTAAVPPQLLA